ncbi:MAG: GIY-YIG nuclease family protein [Labilibaculum antarcticum]
MFYCYVIYSNQLNRFYIGSTELQAKYRLTQHNQKCYGASKFTAKANDGI